MLISTILLIANLTALIINGHPFMSFWWNVIAYPIEILIYLIIIFIIAIIGAIISK